MKCDECDWDGIVIRELYSDLIFKEGETDLQIKEHWDFCSSCGKPLYCVEEKMNTQNQLRKHIRSTMKKHDSGYLWTYEERYKASDEEEYWYTYPNMHWWFFFKRPCKYCFGESYHKVLLTQNIPTNTEYKNGSYCICCGAKKFENKSIWQNLYDKWRTKYKPFYTEYNKARKDFVADEITFKEYKEITKAFCW